ncbi:ester cyclase [Chloroflexi bacterium TSY]|nr:ester cyclase [Chloroflexi bacterium TSY]
MSMQNFSSEFQTPEQYIIDITYRIWEERGVGRIRDWYADQCPVRTPHGVTDSAEAVVANTLATLHEFPDRELLPEDVIIGDKPSGFYSSHRVRSVATHQGDGSFGAATNRPITMLTIADCLCRDNQVVEEWLVRDQAGIARQLGLDPVVHGKAAGISNPEAYAIGNEAMQQRWADLHGLTIEGDESIAHRIIDTYDAMWNGKNLNIMTTGYDRALRFEGPAAALCYSRIQAGNIFFSIMSSIPNGRFDPHHAIVRQQPEKPIRVALRWSYCGTHIGTGRYGSPTGSPLALLGISHFELRDGLIVNECMLIDETAIYAQIAAYQVD